MRLLINLCRYCTVDKKTCPYRKELKSAVNSIKLPGTLIHNCSKYGTILTSGTKVKIMLKEIMESQNYCEPPEYEWHDAGRVSGTISGCCRGFYIIKLDEPVELNLPVRGMGWDSARYVDITHIRKRLKDIEVRD